MLVVELLFCSPSKCESAVTKLTLTDDLALFLKYFIFGQHVSINAFTKEKIAHKYNLLLIKEFIKKQLKKKSRVLEELDALINLFGSEMGRAVFGILRYNLFP